MTYRLFVLIAGVMGYIGCLVWFQDSILRTVLFIFCAFVIGVGGVLVSDKFEHLESEVDKLREQITRMEREENYDKRRSA